MDEYLLNADPVKPTQQDEDDALYFCKCGHFEIIRIVGGADKRANCIGWAFGDALSWWWTNFNILLVQELGGEFFTDMRCSKKYDPDIVKLAAYMERNGKINHLARLLPDGEWLSKSGDRQGFTHKLQAPTVETCYGRARGMYLVPTNSWLSIRERRHKVTTRAAITANALGV